MFSLFSWIWSIINSGVSFIKTDMGKFILDLAIKHVTQAEYNSELTPGRKRRQVFHKIKSDIKNLEDDTEVPDHLINYAIETAVAHLKKNSQNS
jgi:hypothetical protein